MALSDYCDCIKPNLYGRFSQNEPSIIYIQLICQKCNKPYNSQKFEVYPNVHNRNDTSVTDKA